MPRPKQNSDKKKGSYPAKENLKTPKFLPEESEELTPSAHKAISPKRTPTAAKIALLLLSCIILAAVGSVLVIKSTEKINQPPNPTTTSYPTDNSPAAPKITESEKKSRTLLDFYLSNSRENVTYIVLSDNDGQYLLAISEDKNLRAQFLKKKFQVGQKISAVTSKPIKFKKEPKEIIELRKKLKKLKLVLLKELETIDERKF